MAKIIRFIFRLDYDLSYEFMERQVEVFKLIHGFEPDFWKLVEESVDRTLRGVYTNQERTEYRELILEPKVLHLQLETLEGFEFNEFLGSNLLSILSRQIAALCDLCKIEKVRRVGLRVNVADGYGEEYEDSLTNFMSLMNESLVNSLTKIVGEPKDAGIVVDGATPYGTNYKILFGNFRKSDIVKTVQRVRVPKDHEFPYHVSGDFDFWHFDTTFKGITLARWTKDKLPIINDFMLKSLRKLMDG